MNSPIKGVTCLALAVSVCAPVSLADELTESTEQIEAVDTVVEELVEAPAEGHSVRAPDDMGVIGFDAAMVDFGDVEVGSLLEHTFLFLNNGFAPLTVSRGYSQTSGVAVRISTEAVPPDELGEIYVLVNTDGMQGEQMIRLLVETDAFNGPISTLYVKANVWPVGGLPEVAEMEDAGE